MNSKFQWHSYHAHFATISIFLLLNPLGIYLFEFEYWIYYITIPIIWFALCFIDKKNPDALKVNSLAFVLFSVFATAYIRVIENSVNEESLIFLLPFFVLLSQLTITATYWAEPLLKRFVTILWGAAILIAYLLVIVYIVNGPITKDTVFAVLQTHSSEAGELLMGIFFEPLLYLLTFIVLCPLFAFKLLPASGIRPAKGVNTNIAFIILSLGLSIIQSRPEAYAGVMSISENIETYFQEIEKLKAVVAMRNKQLLDTKTSTKTKKGEVYVLVIGESLSSYHMSEYGYALETTPWMSATATTVFENARANHTHTMSTLSKALTASNQYNGKDYYESESIISVAKKAGFKTAWISNQVSMGAWDNLVSVIAQESDYYKFINRSVGKSTITQLPDEYLVPELSNYLTSIDSIDNHLIIIHMMGSHWSYCARTRGLDIKLRNLPRYVYLGKHNVCYDKSVKYTDSVLEQIHGTLLAQQNFKGLLFTSDHGDDVFGKKIHNSAFFTEHMTDIPLIFWAGVDFEQDLLATLQKNKGLYFTNDLIFDTLIGIMAIESDASSARYDISSPNYVDLRKSGTTLHGQASLAELPSLASRFNVQLHSKLMAHRVNTVGSLGDAKKQYFNAIEFDVVYDEARGKIVMGHGKKAMTGQTFENYLQYEGGQFDRLWIDFKGLTDSNFVRVSEELELLDRGYDLKSRALLESGTKSVLFSHFSEQGWQTSYYLPTQEILDLVKGSNRTLSERTAHKIVLQVQAQKIRSLSFDSRIFSFVDEFLYPALSQDVRLNTWTSLSTASARFTERLNKMKIAKDDRIDSIIVRHVTRFRM